MSDLSAVKAARERPIIFSGESVRAIIDGRKTQTRRIVTPQPERKCSHGDYYRGNKVIGHTFDDGQGPRLSPYGSVGDRLWVREVTYIDIGAIPSVGCLRAFHPDSDLCVFQDGRRGKIPFGGEPAELLDLNSSLKKTNPRFMPRWSSRLTLEITDMRVERLQEITESDVLKEGIGFAITRDCKRPQFARLWDEINGKRAPWESNPWVWVVGFRLIA